MKKHLFLPALSTLFLIAPSIAMHNDDFDSGLNKDAYIFAYIYLRPLCTQEFDHNTIKDLPQEL